MGQELGEEAAVDPIKELDIMRRVAEALSGVDAESARRVLRWANELFGQTAGSRPERQPQEAPAATGELTELADLFAAVQPSTGPEKALLAAYWLQEIMGSEDLEAQTLNSHLKHLGHALSNVTATMSLLMNQHPALVVQTRKQGTSRQARKRYRVTVEGVRRVKQLIARHGGSEAAENP